jgi:hypothetical protein
MRTILRAWSGRIGSVLGLLLLTLVLVLILQEVAGVLHGWEEGRDGGGDLKQHYTVGRMLESSPDYRPIYRDFVFSQEVTRLFSREAYDEGRYLDRHNYRYGPLVAWFSWKLLTVPYPWWLAGWLVFSCACAGISWILLRGCAKVRSGSVLFFSFPPLLYGLSIFQNHLLTLVIAASVLFLLAQTRPFLAGLVFGCLAAYKPQLLPYVAGLMLLAGQWRFFGGAALTGAAWVILSLLLCGWEAHLLWWESLQEIFQGIQGDEMQTNASWKGFVLTVFPEGLQSVGSLLTGLLGLSAAAALVGASCRGRIRLGAVEYFSLALGWWLLFTPHVKAYELVLALPLWLLLRREKETGFDAWGLSLWLIGLAAAACRFLDFSPAAPLLTVWWGAALWSLAWSGVAEQRTKR